MSAPDDPSSLDPAVLNAHFLYLRKDLDKLLGAVQNMATKDDIRSLELRLGGYATKEELRAVESRLASETVGSRIELIAHWVQKLAIICLAISATVAAGVHVLDFVRANEKPASAKP